MSNRRHFFRNAFGLGAGLFSASRVNAQSEADTSSRAKNSMHELPLGAPVAAQTPDVKDLPFTLDNGIKVFHLIAEPVRQEIEGIGRHEFDSRQSRGPITGPDSRWSVHT